MLFSITLCCVLLYFATLCSANLLANFAKSSFSRMVKLDSFSEVLFIKFRPIDRSEIDFGISALEE